MAHMLVNVVMDVIIKLGFWHSVLVGKCTCVYQEIYIYFMCEYIFFIYSM